MTTQPVYDEIIEFIASGPTPQEIIDFSVSEETKARVADLLRREKIRKLKWSEEGEVENLMYLEHIMRLVKARARKHVSHE